MLANDSFQRHLKGRAHRREGVTNLTGKVLDAQMQYRCSFSIEKRKLAR